MSKFKLFAQMIEDQIREKRADVIGCRQFVRSDLVDDRRVKNHVAESMGHSIARLMVQKANLTGMPSANVYVVPDDPFKPRFDGDIYEATVVAVHPDLWFQITTLLRDLRNEDPTEAQIESVWQNTLHAKIGGAS